MQLSADVACGDYVSRLRIPKSSASSVMDRLMPDRKEREPEETEPRFPTHMEAMGKSILTGKL